MSTTEFLINKLKDSGMRITPQRIAICQMISESTAHPTAAMICESIRRQYPSLSLATVYNTLDTLAGLGAITILGQAGDDNVHYDGNRFPHVHFACIACHKIEDIDYPEIAGVDFEIANRLNYKIMGACFMYYGLCPDCQKLKQS
jgi:Fur family peroxide stress response transcriptional regulator